MAFPIGTHVVINDHTNQAAASGTVVGYTTFEADTTWADDAGEPTRETRHYYIVELDEDDQRPLVGINLFVKQIVVHEDYLRRSRGNTSCTNTPRGRDDGSG